MEKQKLIRSAGTVGFFILLSRALGMVRDMGMAAFFGSALAMDAFVVAFTIPNLFRSLFGEGALSSAFVPVFTETLEKDGREKVWSFANNMFSFLALILAVIVLVGLLAVSVFKACFPDSPRLLAIFALTRIMLPYMFFICLAAFFSAMLNTLKHFFMPAATYAALNIVMIAALWLVCPRLSSAGPARILAMAWSVILAGIIQWLMQLPLLWQCGFRLKLKFDWRDERVRRVWQLMAAAAVGLGVTQINVLLDRLIATVIGAGAPSYLYYAERLIYFPLGIFGTALGTVLLPAFSTHMARARADLVRQTLNHALRQLTFLALPASLGLFILARPIIQVIYERGGFSAHTTEMTALALFFYAPGLLAFSLLKILIPVFYARQDMKTPVRIGIICTLLSVILKLILMWPLRHAGIAFGSVIAATAEVIILLVLIQRRFGALGWRNISVAFAKMLAAGGAMSAVALAVNSAGLQFFSANGCSLLLTRLFALLAALGLAIFTYLVVSLALRCEEARELWNALRHKGKYTG